MKKSNTPKGEIGMTDQNDPNPMTWSRGYSHNKKNHYHRRKNLQKKTELQKFFWTSFGKVKAEKTHLPSMGTGNEFAYR